MSEELYQLKIFQPAREYLLKYQDERESIIRLCRDINSHSKKIIFTIHRINNNTINEKVYNQVFENIKILSEKLSIIYFEFSFKENFQQFKSTISNSIEEMIEAFTFSFFIMNNDILSFQKFLDIVKCLILSYNYKLKEFNNKLIRYSLNLLLFETSTNNIISPDEVEAPIESLDFEINFILQGDYLMGLFDLTGEIMRFSISNLTDKSDQINSKALQNLIFLKKLNQQLFELFSKYPNLNINKGLISVDYEHKNVASIQKKLQVLKQSLSKVESMICDIFIRGNELVPTSIDLNDYE